MLLFIRGEIDRHCKKYVITDADPVMSCTAVPRKVNVSMPSCWFEVKIEELCIYRMQSTKAKIQRWNYALFSIFINTDGTIRCFCGFSRVIYKIVFFNYIVSIGIIRIGNVFIKVFSLRYKTIFCGVAYYICNWAVRIFLTIFLKCVRKNGSIPWLKKTFKTKFRILSKTVTWGLFYKII